jgi:hypothetical protein
MKGWRTSRLGGLSLGILRIFFDRRAPKRSDRGDVQVVVSLRARSDLLGIHSIFYNIVPLPPIEYSPAFRNGSMSCASFHFLDRIGASYEHHFED